MKALVFGSCNLDYTYLLNSVVQLGETQLARDCRTFPGGKGLNQAIALKRAGADCYFGGCIGEDGELLSSTLRETGINTEYLDVIKTRTGHAIIQVDEQGDNAIFVYPGANHSITKEYIDKVLLNFGAGDHLLVQNEISNLQYLIRSAAKTGMKVILNPSPFTEDLRKIDLDDLYCIVLNETEASQWMQSVGQTDMFSYVSQHHPDLMVVLTLGQRGSVCLYRQLLHRQSAYCVKAVDSTAAGDCFTGYFAAGLIRGETIDEALRKASAAAAISVSRAGASVSIPVLREVEELLPVMQLQEDDEDH